MHKHFIVLSLTIFIMAIFHLMVAAQDVETPTPAPSKTPTLVSTATLEATATTSNVATPSPTHIPPVWDNLRQYTQSDLHILVGNVQRPNAIVWLNNNLYTACSGDFTLYKIDVDTGTTVTFSSGVRDTNVIWPEITAQGFNLWIPDFDTNTLLRGDNLQGLPAVVVRDNLDGPWGLAPLDSEHFLITNALSDTIVLANREGTSNIVMTGLRYPTGIVVSGEYGYVANRGSARRAIEWFNVKDIDPETISDELTHPFVSGLQNVSNLVLAQDGYLYFTYSLAERGVVGRVHPDKCRDEGCTNEQVEIVILTDGRTAPLAGLTISDDMRLFVHTVYDSKIFWVQLYN